MEKITIEKVNGKWTVNGVPLSEMTQDQQDILNSFFKAMKNL